MNDELTARHRAITLRLGGDPSPESRCRRPAQGLVSQMVEPVSGSGSGGSLRPDAGQSPRRPTHFAELERTILSIRRRLQADASPATRYSLIGATAILAELKALDIRPLVCERTIERVLERTA